MSNLIEAIDRATSGLCPCGAPPADGSAYCSDDCRPTHISGDTDTRDAGHLATPMRWRPDLVTEASDDGLTLWTGPMHVGGLRRNIYYRDGTDLVHLRLDDGHRFVGRDVERGDGGEEFAQRCHDAWRRLERELVNPRHIEPEDVDPFADVMPPRDTPRSDLFTWTRRCRACGRRSQPIVGRRVRLTDPARIHTIASIYDLSGDLIEDIETCDLCAYCRSPFSGPVLAAFVYCPEVAESVQFGIAARLVLRSQRHKWGRVVTDRELDSSAESPREVIERIWDEMEEALLRLIDNEQHAETSEALAYDCVEAGRLAHQAISEYFAGGPAVRGVPPTSAHFGVPVVLVEDLAPQAWRLIDLNGSVVGEGHIAADVAPEPANRIQFARVGTDPFNGAEWTEVSGYLANDGLAAAVGLRTPMSRDEVMARFREAYERTRARRSITTDQIGQEEGPCQPGQS